jgi:acetyl esterase/lipase
MSAWLGVLLATPAVALQPPLPPDVIAEENIEYANPGKQHLKLDLYRPKEGGPHPVVICIHGGGFVGGQRESMRWICVRLASEGYAAATIQYRLAPKYRFPACVEDCKAAVRWVRANAEKYNFDPNRIAAMGTSAGGHLSVFLAATADVKEFEGDGGHREYSSRIACAVNVFGPSDFTRIQGKSKSEPVLEPFLGGTLDTHRQQYIRASPLFWITPNTAPVLTLIGTKDEHVPLEQAKWLHERLEVCGVSNELVVLEGAGHGFKGKDQEKAQAAMLAFLARHLKNVPAPIQAEPPPEKVPPNIAPRKAPFVLVLPAYRNCDKLRGRPKTRLPGVGLMGYRPPHETDLLSYRPDRGPVAADRPLGPPAEAGRTSGEVFAPGDCQCDPVCDAQWLHVARPAARLPAVSDCVSLLPAVAEGRDVGDDPCPAARAGAAQDRSHSQTLGRHPRQPEREDH